MLIKGRNSRKRNFDDRLSSRRLHQVAAWLHPVSVLLLLRLRIAQHPSCINTGTFPNNIIKINSFCLNMKLQSLTTLLFVLVLQVFSVISNPDSSNELLHAFEIDELDSSMDSSNLQKRSPRRRRRRCCKRFKKAMKKAVKKVGSGVKMVVKSTIKSVKQLAKDCTGKGNIKDCLKAVAKQAGSMAGNMLVPGLGTAISMGVTAGTMAKKHL
jgi:hypothetical protein